MNLSSKLIEQVEHYVTTMLIHHLSTKFCYHNLQHTKTVVKGVRVIASHTKLAKEQVYILQLAAWFHDIGFLGSAKGHELLSTKIATNYLKTKKVASGVIHQVCDCILATEKNARFEGFEEAIIQDADLFHLNETNYWELNSKLRDEIADTNGKHYSHYEWYEKNLKFLNKISFNTEYGKIVLNNRRNWLIIENEKLLDSIKNSKSKYINTSLGLFSSAGYGKSIELSSGSIPRI